MSTISGFNTNLVGKNYAAKTVKPDILAPGTSVGQTSSLEEKVVLSGSGFASPVVAGKAALLMGANPDMSMAELRETLIKDSQKGVLLGDALRTMALVSADTTNSVAAAALPGTFGATLGANLTTGVDGKGYLAPEESAKIADRMAQTTLNAAKSLSVGHYNGSTGGFIPAAMGATTGMWSGKNPVTVAIIDSGADADHPALQGKLVAGSATTDELGSGTHIAGVIADPLGKHYQM